MLDLKEKGKRKNVRVTRKRILKRKKKMLAVTRIKLANSSVMYCGKNL